MVKAMAKIKIKKSKTLCIFCSSSDDVSDKIKEEGAKFAEQVAKNGYNLLYGGTAQGLMRVVADAHHNAGGYLIGVIPDYMTSVDELKKRFVSGAAHLDNLGDQGKLYNSLDEVVTVDDLGPRKQIMLDMSDVVVCLPGGIGTYDEFFTVLTLKQVGSHSKPIYLLNSDNYFDALVELINHGIAHNTVKKGNLNLFKVCNTSEELFADLLKNC